MQVTDSVPSLILGKTFLFGGAIFAVLTLILLICRSNYAKISLKAYLFCLISALLIIIKSFLTTNLKLLIVANNSHKLLPLMYKLTGVWGTNSGSLLLLNILVLLCGLIWIQDFSSKTGKIFITICFIITIITTNANPFERNNDIIPQGKGFNPLLQDIAIAIHPPILYLGNAIQIIIFALQFESKNKNLIIKINKLSWSLLTAGIGLGSWWAYRELGWGGIWFWDPVENLSLLPWLASTALLHLSAKNPNSISFKLASMSGAFSFIFGMMIIRSGLITSVHSFASDSKSTSVFISSGLAFIAMFYISLNDTNLNSNIKNKKNYKLIFINNLLLLISGIIIFISVLFPIISKYFYGKEVELNANFYVKTFTPICIVMLALMSFTYQRESKKWLLLLSTMISFFIWYFISFNQDVPLLSNITLLLSINTFFYSILTIRKNNFVQSLGHLSIALLFFALILHFNLSKSYTLHLKHKQSIFIDGNKVTLISIKNNHSTNFISRVTEIDIEHKNKNIKLYPEIRFFPIEKYYTVESDSKNVGIFDEFYVTSGSVNQGAVTCEIKLQSYIRLIWFSASLLFCTGIISYFQKRKNGSN